LARPRKITSQNDGEVSAYLPRDDIIGRIRNGVVDPPANELRSMAPNTDAQVKFRHPANLDVLRDSLGEQLMTGDGLATL